MSNPVADYPTTYNDHLGGQQAYIPTGGFPSASNTGNDHSATTRCSICVNILLPTDFDCVYCHASNPRYGLRSSTEQENKLHERPLKGDSVAKHSFGFLDTGGMHSESGDWPQTETAFASSSCNFALGSSPPASYDNVASRLKRSVSMQSGASFDTIGTPEIDAAQPTKKKAAKQAAPLPGWEGDNPSCQMCPRKKAFKATVFNHGLYCNKHTRKVMKEDEAKKGHMVMWTDDQGATTTELAMAMVYPAVPPLEYAGDGEDDWVFYEEQTHQNAVVKGFVSATNTRYTDAMDPGATADEKERHVHENFIKQQRDYDHKPWEEASIRLYTDKWIITRMRLLFLVILTYHRGGTSIYPIGGANNGYGEDKTLTMTQRISEITGILARDKRVVMDVIEGRGVAALAANPGKFEERKTSNFKCNAKKKRKLEASAVQPMNAEHQHTEATTTGDVPSLVNNEEEVIVTPILESQAGRRKPGPKRRKQRQAELDSSMAEHDTLDTGLAILSDLYPTIPHTSSAIPDTLSNNLDQDMYDTDFNPVLANHPLQHEPFPGSTFQQQEEISAQYTASNLDASGVSLDLEADDVDFSYYLEESTNQELWGASSSVP